MVESIRSRVFSESTLIVLSSCFLVALGTGVVLETSVTLPTLSPIVLALSGAYGLAIGIALEVDPLRRVFDRAQNLIIALSIFFSYLLIFDGFADPIRVLAAFSLALGLGALVGTLGVVLLRST